jgi:hypothetical protein
MKFGEYLDRANKLVAENPDILDMDVVYASDEEGNSFHKAYTGISLGLYKSREFIPLSQFEEYEIPETIPNAVCLN